METITIEEFKNLVPRCCLDSGLLCGKFAIGDHRKISETVKIGDIVSFLIVLRKTDIVDGKSIMTPLINIVEAEVVEKIKMETIKIEEFKNLPVKPSVENKGFGRFAINEKAQKKQCKNLKVGDAVFFLETKDKGRGKDGIPQIDVTVVQATVVE